MAGILAAVLAVCLGVALATRAAPATQAARSAPSASSASRPQHVAGYTAHALQRMRERGVSKAEITGLITSRVAGTWQTDARTWKVTGNGLTVIISSDAKIVTVWKT